MRTLIKHVLATTEPEATVTVKGWVRTRRDAKGFSFLELNDGSCLGSLQCVVDAGTPGYDGIAHFTTGASGVIEGKLVPSPAQGQKWELRATRVELIGPADASYPLQKKGHTMEVRTGVIGNKRTGVMGYTSRQNVLEKCDPYGRKGVLVSITRLDLTGSPWRTRRGDLNPKVVAQVAATPRRWDVKAASPHPAQAIATAQAGTATHVSNHPTAPARNPRLNFGPNA